MAAMFLRHEGFLGAVGAFMKVQALQGPRDRDARKVRSAGGRTGDLYVGGSAEGNSVARHAPAAKFSSLSASPACLLLVPVDRACPLTMPTPAPLLPPTQVRARFVERFSMGAPVMGGEVRGPAITGARFWWPWGAVAAWRAAAAVCNMLQA